MTILHLTPSYVPNKGGVETHVAAVVKLQQQAGHRVVVLTKPKPHTKLATWRFSFAHLNDFLKAEVIQVHDVFWWILPIFPILLLNGKKMITTFHGWEGRYPVRWQAKLQRLLYNKLSSKVVHVGAWIQEFYWDKPDAVVYGGVDSGLQVITTSSKNKKQLNVVFIGRLVAENEVEKYLHLIDQLKKNVKQNIKVTWVGDGKYRRQCEAVGEVVGMVDQPSVYLVSADLVLATSYLSILEAQSLGKVVVALYSHPLKQRYLETFPGYEAMVVGSDPVKVANELNTLFDDQKKWRKFQQQSVQNAQEHSWQKIASLYQKLAS